MMRAGEEGRAVKDLQGSARAQVAADVERCFALLREVERYPDWYPQVVRRVEVLERDADGRATRAQAALHVAHGPIVRDFELLLAVHAEPSSSVRLERVPHGASDGERFEVLWHLRPGRATELRVELRASLAVPRLLPLGGVADAIAGGFARAAAAELDSPG